MLSIKHELAAGVEELNGAELISYDNLVLDALTCILIALASSGNDERLNLSHSSDPIASFSETRRLHLPEIAFILRGLSHFLNLRDLIEDRPQN